MSPYFVIGLVILGCGVFASYAWRRGWFYVALAFWYFETQARAARDRARQRCPMCGGSGLTIGMPPCPTCDGTGQVPID